MILALALSVPVIAENARPISKGRKTRIALAGLFDEVNTFEDETMGKAKIIRSMATGMVGAGGIVVS